MCTILDDVHTPSIAPAGWGAWDRPTVTPDPEPADTSTLHPLDPRYKPKPT